MNLKAINQMRNKYNLITGLSDHSMGDHMILASLGFGAKVIEKHFTLNRKMSGPDHKFAMMPLNLRKWSRK